MKKFFAGLVILALAMQGARADQIVLKNGSVIKGSKLQVHGGKVKITTDFAGELSIDRAHVATMTSDQPVMVNTADGKKTSAVITPAGDGKASITSELGQIQLPMSDVVAIWPVGAADPTIPPPPAARAWAYEAGLNIAGKTGNTEKFGIGANLKGTLTGPSDKLLLYLKGRYARENSVENEQEIIVGADYEHRIKASKHSWYTRTELEHDEINNIDFYFTGVAGYGYYIADKKDFTIRLRTGLSYQYKTYDDDQDDDSSLGLDFGYHHNIKLQDWGRLTTDITYTPTFDSIHDYRIFHESALSIPIGNTKNWFIRLGISNDYNSRVSDDVDRLDTTYFGQLVYSWK
ncbi:MAG: DUF481 domain-containing protein [Lentisphaerae bacterium]|jgi:hypothetical protein|nr:DUF481 domain-containing protein [Lentisphaerota bacterium]